jgi:ribonucleoside-diphosphate reductase alpha chain
MMKKEYTLEEVNVATLKYYKGDELARDVWRDKYCLKQAIPDTKDFIYLELTPDDMHRRIAREFARIEAKYPEPMEEDEIYELLKDSKYIVPQGSPSAGIGNNFAITSISNCFVIGGHPDSYGGLFMADQEQAQLMKRRGGVGQDLSYLRPSGAIAGTQPLGPNAGMPLYMDRFSNTTREVQQDGRRGALMLSVSINHPDAEKFIDKKMTSGAVTGANVSVKITKEFMKALKDKSDFYQTFPTEKTIEEILPPSFNLEEVEIDKLYQGIIVDGVQTYFKKVDIDKIWKKISFNAWSAAEPGILFWSKIIEESPAAYYGSSWKEISTNPCGEIPLPPYDSCRLLLVNLYSYISNAFTKEAVFEDDLFIDHVAKAMRLMDDIVDLEIEKIDLILAEIDAKVHKDIYQQVERTLWEKVREKAVDGRRTGLGITGEGDMMAALGIRYGTPEATLFAEKLHQLFATSAYSSSIELAEERGAFPMWDPNDIEASGFLTRMFSLEENELMTPELLERLFKFGRRNIGILTIAPAGSISILTQTTSGVEPMFAAWYFRKKKVTFEDYYDYLDEVGDKWVEFPVFHKPFVDWFAASEGIDFERAYKYLLKQKSDVLTPLFEQSPYYKATAQDVDYVEKVKMQGAIQKWIDHSISVTVNMPEHVTEKMVADVYMMAFESGCKGVTVYRDNSRGNVLSTTSVKDVNQAEEFTYLDAHKRPTEVDCDVFFKTSRGEDFVIFVGLVEGKPYEVFAVPNNDKIAISKKVKTGTITKIGKAYQFVSTDGKATIPDLGPLMIETEQNETRTISALLRHKVNPLFVGSMVGKFATISSFHKVIEKVILSYVKEGGIKCPVCETKMTMTEGCMKCPSCGHAHCG